MSHCYPFRVGYTPLVGRHVVASRDIKALEVIVRDSPAVVAPHSRPVCLVCIRDLRPDRTEACPRCRFPLCDEKCARDHSQWPECEVFADIFADKEAPLVDPGAYGRPSVVYASVGYIRMLTAAAEAHDEAHEEDPTKTYSWLMRLMDHMEDLQKDPPMKAHLEALLEATRKIGSWTERQKLKAFGILRINAFGYTSFRGGEGGRALYPIMSLFSHSCLPNAQHVQKGGDGEVTVVAQRDIARGQEVTISYVNQFQGKAFHSYIEV